MPGRASVDQVKELVLGVGAGVPADISEADASRNLADMSQIHLWLQLGLITDLSEVNMDVIKQILRQVPSLLQLVDKVTVAALPTFDVATHFVLTPQYKRRGAEVFIGCMSEDAKLLVKGLGLEPELPEATLKAYRLLRASGNDQIIAQLRGDREAQAIVTSWAQMYEMMRWQGRGQKGFLLTNGYANVFYVGDSNNVLWAASCRWICLGDCYWSVYACPVTFPDTWPAGSQVLSR